MSEISDRLRARVARDFIAPGAAREVVRLVAGASDSERIQAAIVLASGGDFREIERGIALAALDWRDVLVNGGLADQDWLGVLDRELGDGGTG